MPPIHLLLHMFMLIKGKVPITILMLYSQFRSAIVESKSVS